MKTNNFDEFMKQILRKIARRFCIKNTLKPYRTIKGNISRSGQSLRLLQEEEKLMEKFRKKNGEILFREFLHTHKQKLLDELDYEDYKKLMKLAEQGRSRKNNIKRDE